MDSNFDKWLFLPEFEGWNSFSCGLEGCSKSYAAWINRGLKLLIYAFWAELNNLCSVSVINFAPFLWNVFI